MAGDRFDLGVLLVHGIGTQRSGETLVQWGDALVKAIAPATGGKVTASVHEADAGSAEVYASAEVLLDYDGHPERWLLVEGWWADAFPAPTYAELVSWSVRALPWALSLHIAARYWQRIDEQRSRYSAAFLAVVQLLVLLSLSPLLLAFLGLTVLLGILPIPQLRTAILSAQSILTGTIGDSLAFVDSPVRAALIRNRIRVRLDSLKSACDRTIVIAHSQGAAATFDALGGIVDPASGRTTANDARLAAAAPDTLLTFGAGTNQLASQLRVAGPLPKEFAFNPALAAPLALMAAWGLTAYLWREMQAGRVSPSQLGWGLVYFLAWMATFAGVLAGTLAAVASARARWAAVERNSTGVTAVLLTVPLLVVVGGGLPLAQRLSLHAGVWTFIAATAGVLVGALAAILSPTLRAFLTSAVRFPPGVKHWLDIYATADPVPHGSTRVCAPSEAGPSARTIREMHCVANEGSVLSDHVTYWNNLDGFVLRVVGACAQTAGSGWLKELTPVRASFDDRAKWRVSILRVARGTMQVTWLLAAVLLARDYALRLPLPFDLPRALPVPVAQTVLYVAGMAIGAWLSAQLVHAVWSLWARSEQRANIRQAPLPSPMYPLLAIVLPVWGMLIATWSATASSRDVWGTSALTVTLLVFLIASAVILLRPSPTPELPPIGPATKEAAPSRV